MAQSDQTLQNTSSTRFSGSSHGFTLPELLVALALLALLLPAFFTSHLAVQQHLQDGTYRARAASIAMDMLNRMRTTARDPAARAVYLQLSVSFASPSAVSSVTVPDFRCHHAIRPCTPVQIAVADLQEIHYYLALALPAAAIQLTACGHDSLCLIISWLGMHTDQCDTDTSSCFLMKFNI